MDKKIWYMYLGVFLILDALFPILAYFALQNMPTLWLVIFSIGVSFLCWLFIFFQQKLYQQYKKKEILFPTFLSALFLWMGGLLYFFGIEYSSPSIASTLLLLQSFFAFIVFNLFGKESYTKRQVTWALLMFIGGVIILYRWESVINTWVFIMLVAGIMFTLWNYYTKQASLKWANSFFLLINRNFLIIIITTILALTFIWPIEFELVQQNLLWIFLIWFFTLFIWKIAWIWALKNLSSFVAISTFPLIPLLVIVFSVIILNEVPSSNEIIGFIPILIWSLLLIKN